MAELGRVAEALGLAPAGSEAGRSLRTERDRLIRLIAAMAVPGQAPVSTRELAKAAGFGSHRAIAKVLERG